MNFSIKSRPDLASDLSKPAKGPSELAKMKKMNSASGVNIGSVPKWSLPGANSSTGRQLMAGAFSTFKVGEPGSPTVAGYQLSNRHETAPDSPKLSAKNVENKISIKDKLEGTLITLKINSKNESKQISVADLEMEVKEFKERYFAADLAVEGTGVRLICGGKEMRDSHKLSDHIKPDLSSFIYVFFFKKDPPAANQKSQASLATKHEASMANVTDTDALDFDYFKERQNLTEEEVLWKRFCFHAPLIFRAEIPVINDPVLFKREYEYMRTFAEKRHTPDKFRQALFPGFSPAEFVRERTTTFVSLVVVGMVLGILASPTMLIRCNPAFKVAIMIGMMAHFTLDLALRSTIDTTLIQLVAQKFNLRLLPFG